MNTICPSNIVPVPVGHMKVNMVGCFCSISSCRSWGYTMLNNVRFNMSLFDTLSRVAAAAAGAEFTDAAAEAPAVPAAGFGCWPGGAVASSDGSAHGRCYCQQPQPPGAEGLLF